MGIAKSIEAYTSYPDYTSATDIFIQNLSEKLNADFIINSYDDDFEPLHEEDKQTNFGKTIKYNLTIEYHLYKLGEETNNLPLYTLNIPISYVYEDSLEIVFHPNKLVHICFLTFEHLWGALIDTLKFQADWQDRREGIHRYNTLRNEYSNILKKLNINSILITTHAYYKLEALDWEEKYPSIEFGDILKTAIEKDKLTLWNFEDLIEVKNESELSPIFLKNPELKIALIDNL